jgi:hypothetical protein
MTKTQALQSPLGKPPEKKEPEKKKSSLFSSITTERTPAPRRTLLYGVQGVGKSTWASMAPNPIFLPTEEGINDIQTAKFPLLKSHREVMQGITDLYREQHEFETVVIDSLDWLEQMIWDAVREENNPNIFDDYGKGYVLAVSKWRTLILALDALRQNGMAIILLAHSKIERFEDPETKSYDRFVPRLHKAAAAVLQEWCDEVFFASYKTYTTEVKEKFGGERVQAFGEGERIIRTSERPSCMAKNRLGLPFELALNWKEYAKYLEAK